MTAAPTDTVKVTSHLMLLLYSLGFSNLGIRLLAFGMIVGFVNVNVPDASDLSPLPEVKGLLRDVEGVE